MEPITSRNTAAIFRKTSRVAAIVVVLAGMKVITGWVFHIPWLTGQWQTPTFVAPNSALLFVVSGTAILLVGARRRRFALAGRCLGALIAIFGLATVAEYLFHAHFGIDTLFLRSAVANWTVTPTPGRFAVQTALACSDTGLALLLSGVTWRKYVLAEPFSAFVFLVAFFGMLGYLYSATQLYGVMAIETTTFVLCLGLALLLHRPDQGMMALVASDRSAGIVARRLLAATAVVIPVLGYLQVVAGTYDWMGRQMRNALFAAGTVLAVWLLVVSAARAIEAQESRRRESEERFRSLSASSPVGILLSDAQGRPLYTNPRFSAICGFTASHGERWIEHVYEEDRERVERSWQAAVLQQKDWMEEVRWKTPASAPRWTICRGAPMRAEDGTLLGYAGTVEDVTERKLAESTLRKTEKLAAMGRLAGIIAHEINNPLEALTNLFYLLRNHASLDAEAREFAVLAEQQLRRVASITRQSLSFYRESAQPKPVALDEVLRDVLGVYGESAAAQNIAVERRLETDGVVMAQPGELRQVFVNIVGNAIQAMPRGGRLRVHLFPAMQRKGSGRAGVRVNVIDTGEGVSGEAAARIFEPFFTTKAEKGTGLGLWVSRGIVEKHDGHIAFRSTRHPSSTCFSVFIPTVTQQVRRPRNATSEAATGTHGR